ncbi:MAG TPA: hypothetical protein VER17_07865 [Tepidisphaeraceae bacterium]|nr:hypothetical protein [Tepidisphaeraceae bacterium]
MMKTITKARTLLLALAAIPRIAFAHEGHGEVASSHEAAHALLGLAAVGLLAGGALVGRAAYRRLRARRAATSGRR